MPRMLPDFRFPLALAIGLAAPADAAFALELDDFTSKLQAALAGTDVELSFDDATLSGDMVTLTGAELQPEGAPPFRFETMTFRGVEEKSDGGYTVEEARVPDVEVEEDGVTVTMRDISVSALDIPADTEGDEPLANMIFYERGRMGETSVVVDDTEVFSIDETVIDVSRRPDNAGLDTTVRAEGMVADLSMVEDPKVKAALEAFGYERLTGRFALSAGWDTEDGTVDISDYSLEVDDVGKLAVSLRFSGYTPEFLAAVEETQEQAEAGASEEMTGMAVLGLMQQLTFERASVRFDDAGLTAKALDYAGSQQGIDGEQMAAAVKGMLPFFLGQLQNPEFQQEISEAVDTFLDDPQNLTIRADPEEPVSFMTIVGAVSASPQTLPDMLNVTVSANE